MTSTRAALLALGLTAVACGSCIVVQVPAPTPDTSTPAPDAPRLATPGHRLRRVFTSLPPGSTAELRLLTDNPEAWTDRWRMLAGAERTLDVNYFILHEDVIGVAFLGHLMEKARRGVRVRIVLDGLGTTLGRSFRGEDYLDELAGAGIVVKTYRPLWTRYVEALVTMTPTAAFASNHDKIIVADGGRSLIGGRNIGVEYFASPEAGERIFRDVDLRLDSPALGAALTTVFESQYGSERAWKAGGELLNLRPLARELQLAYEAMDRWLRGVAPDATFRTRMKESGVDWQTEVEKLPALRGALAKRPRRPLTAETRLLDSPTRSGPSPDPITQAIARLVRAARRTILIQSPYFVLSEEGMELLADAGRRGVAITVLTNSPVSSDNALSQAFFLEQWPELLARVPHLRLFVAGKKHTLHGKTATFDDRVALVGTYNVDPSSMALNSEVVAAVWSRRFAREVAREPRRRVATGMPEVYEYAIRRSPSGKALRGGDGKPIVAFGPRNHSSPESWSELTAYWTLLKTARYAGFSPIL
jgi:phosphatidylserine/phosphatidylglycerophosphate/cardiolipin synthase-like enzyme